MVHHGDLAFAFFILIFEKIKLNDTIRMKIKLYIKWFFAVQTFVAIGLLVYAVIQKTQAERQKLLAEDFARKAQLEMIKSKKEN
jgi:hypothetical protein